MTREKESYLHVTRWGWHVRTHGEAMKVLKAFWEAWRQVETQVWLWTEMLKQGKGQKPPLENLEACLSVSPFIYS